MSATRIIGPPNLFQWVSEHTDGSLSLQYGGPGRNFNQTIELATQGKLAKLHLIRLVEGKENYYTPEIRPQFTVDMKTGLFIINGEEHDQRPKGVSLVGQTLRPIYFRSVRGGIGIDGGPSYAPLVKWYRLGWQVTIDGENYQRIIQYDVPMDSFEFKEKR